MVENLDEWVFSIGKRRIKFDLIEDDVVLPLIEPYEVNLDELVMRY